MGTRSTIKFIEVNNEKEIQYINIYRQYDGYIEGVGHELANFLINCKLINGISLGDDSKLYELGNGLGCVIAQYIKKIKECVGNVYIEAPNYSEEYDYIVYFNSDKYFSEDTSNVYKIKVIDCDGKIIFKGTPEELLKFKEE